MTPPVPPRWLRRLVVDPLWVPIGVVLALLFGVIAVLAMIVAPVSRHRRLLRFAVFGLSYVVLDLGLLFGSIGLWLAHPLPNRNARRWQQQHCALLQWALGRLMGVARRTLGFTVEISPIGPIADHGAPLIVLARHAGPGDSFTLVQLIMAMHGRMPRVVLKAALQWDPGLDLVLNRLSGCFLPSRTGAGEDRVARVAELASRLTEDDALLLFPEGGNWTPRRHRRAVARLWRSGNRRAARRARERPLVLPPRPGGTVACLAARPDANVLIVAHAGLDTLVNPAEMWRAVPLVDRPMRVGWWLHQAADVPRDPDAAAEWLRIQWDQVHEWVDSAIS